MIKVLFIAMHRPERSPSQRFRFEQYLSLLNSNGISYDFSFLIDEKDDKVLYSNGKYLGKFKIFLNSWLKRRKDMITSVGYDYIFVQREAFMTGSALFEKGFSKKSKLIFDFDDSIWLPDLGNANKKLMWLKKPGKTKDIIKMSHLVIVGNAYLANYAKQFNSNVTIMPTTIDTDLYSPTSVMSHDQTPVTIGWSGSLTTIKHFELAISALTRIKGKYGPRINFKVIGDGNYINNELDIAGDPWVADSEIEDLQKIDIGIMPLPDDEWSKGKCGLKGLQYMALEIPTIMSPVGVNIEIIQDGENGFLASTEDEWVEKLSRLIEDPELRVRLGIAGRQTVVERYSVEANKERFLKLFEM